MGSLAKHVRLDPLQHALRRRVLLISSFRFSADISLKRA
jgi:hypothetical protein